jgi:hypothetical protein
MAAEAVGEWVPPVVDTALAVVDVVAVVYVMRGVFKRHHLLAEACRYLSYVLRGLPRYLLRGPARGPLASGPGMTVAPCRTDDLGGGVTGPEGCRRRR